MMKLNELPLEGQDQDARVTATVTAELGLQGQAARGQVVRAGLGLVGSYGGGRKLTADGKSFSLKLLDLPVNWRAGYSRGKGCPLVILPHGILFNNPSPSPCLLVPNPCLLSSFLITFPGLYLKLARGKQNRISY